MIRDIAHNHGKTKHGLMAIIESDMELYLGFQVSVEACDNYMVMFKTRVDMKNSHKGRAGKYSGHFAERFSRIQEE